MWKKKRSIGGILLRVFVFLLVAAMAVSFFYYYRQKNEEILAQDKAYVDQYLQQQQAAPEQTVAPIGGSTDVAAAYAADLKAVETYLPGIVCWGDVITGGSAGGVSFPGVLQELIDLNICDKYDFRSTVEFAGNLTKVKWDEYQVEIPVVNMGVGEESSYTVLGRAGAMPYLTKEELTIPAGCESVAISLTNAEGRNVKPLIYGDGGVNPVTVGGITGELTADPSSYSPYSTGKYTFTRLTPGEEITVPEGTEIITSGAELYRDYLHVIFLGTYGDFSDAKSLIAQQKAMIARQTKNSERYIVIGPYTTADSSLPSSVLTQAEALMAQTFGNRFINLRKYLAGDALQDIGITPTKADESNLKYGLVPPSLRATAYSVELNARAYEAIGRVVYERMSMLGYFDEIKDELGITAIEKAEKQAAAQAQTAGK